MEKGQTGAMFFMLSWKADAGTQALHEIAEL